MTNRKNRWIKSAFHNLKTTFENRCCRCTDLDELEFAHIKPTELSMSKPTARGRKERYYDIKKHPECYFLMRKCCHKEYDNQQYLNTQIVALDNGSKP